MPPKPNEMITADPKILRVSPLVSRGGEGVCGFQVWFFGFEFALLNTGVAPGVPTMFDKAMYRPAGFRAVGSNVWIEFSWTGGAQSAEIVMEHVKP